MKNNTLFLAILFLISFSISAQEIRWQESFETDGEGTRYTTSSFFYIGPNDHCRRTDGSDISNVSTFDNSSSYSNIDGTYFWAAEDVDSGGDSLDEKSILFNPINITGLTGLTFKGLFGADGNVMGNGFWQFNYRDFIFLDYSMDGGASFSHGLAFRHTVPPGFDPQTGPLRQDADLNGFGDSDGFALGPVLREYSFEIPNGSSVQFRIRFHIDGPSEEIAFDNFRLEVDALPEVELKVFLEGGYDSGSMANDLIFGENFPQTQPFNTAPWNYSGGEVLSSDLYVNGIAYGIVDWVLIELRDKSKSSTVVSRRAAILMQNGRITDMDGTNNVGFVEAVDDYYITIHHRNHLSIMSANPVTLSTP